MKKNQEFKVSVAPMMDWTDRHCRYFHRLLSSRVRLYTEMIFADAVIHGDRDRLLGCDDSEHPVALQIGGSDPAKLGQAARIGAVFGYDEINLNVGCPSERAQNGRFGACLMAEPDLVAECFTAMRNAADIPVTVKCRLGIDNQDIDRTLSQFLKIVAGAGCNLFIIHARRAWLKGLSPKENRMVPPIMHGKVREMKKRFPDLTIILNGGLSDVDTALEQTLFCNDSRLPVDGVMFGRAAYQNPWILTKIDNRIYGDTLFSRTREEIITELITYARTRETRDPSVRALLRHVLALYAGRPGARAWRCSLSESGKDMLPSQRLAQALMMMQGKREKAA